MSMNRQRPHRAVAAAVLLCGVVSAGAPIVIARQAIGLEEAIVAAVAARMGPSAQVDIRSVAPAGLAGPALRVTLDPAARLGTPLTVTVLNGPSASVRASVDLRVSVAHARVARAIERGQIIEMADLTPITDVVVGLPLKPLPTAEDLVGARAVRTLSAGEIVQNGFVARRQAVRAGDVITAIARVEGAEVSARFTAADAGNIGDVIRIVNPDSRRTLRGRVIEVGKVEVINVR